MNSEDIERIGKVLRRIKRDQWEAFLASPHGGRLRATIDAVVDATVPQLDLEEELKRRGLEGRLEQWAAGPIDVELPTVIRRAFKSARAAHHKARFQAGYQDVAGRAAELLGYGLMQDRKVGVWIREQLLRGARRATWESLLAEYANLVSKKTVPVRANASQRGKVPPT